MLVGTTGLSFAASKAENFSRIEIPDKLFVKELTQKKITKGDFSFKSDSKFLKENKNFNRYLLIK